MDIDLPDMTWPPPRWQQFVESDDLPSYQWEELVGLLLARKLVIAKGAHVWVTDLPPWPHLAGHIHRFQDPNNDRVFAFRLLAWDEEDHRFLARYLDEKAGSAP